MHWLLEKVLFLLFLVYVSGKALHDEDLPKLKWRSKYTLEATKIHLSSDLIEHVKYWRTSKKTRVDYNHGAVKTISIAASLKTLKFGTEYEIYPQTTEEYENKIFCYYTNGSLRHPIKVKEVLPSASDFEYVGKEELGASEVDKFAKISKDELMNIDEEVYIWASLNVNKSYWTPVKIEEIVYKPWLGKVASHYVWNIFNYEKDFDSDVFSVDQYNCTNNQESEEDNLIDNDGSHKHVEKAFLRFVNDYERQYGDQNEYEIRKKIFADNLRFIQSHNRKNTSFKLGINKFSDRTPKEIEKMKGLRRRKEGDVGTVPFPYNKTHIEKLSKELPKEFDLRMLGVITPVRDQDSCGSCWTFGTTSAVEGALARINGGRLLRLANQALIDCAWGFDVGGCNGGSDTGAYNWMMKYGLPTEEEYGPYVNKDGYCRIKNMTKLYPIRGFTDVTPFNNEALKVALIDHGPLSVSIDATDYLLSYAGGIIFDNTCNKNVLNHEVTLVGYGNRDGEEYWIVKNSWGRDWGIDGYFHISTRNVNCGITTEPTYVVF